MKRYFLRPFFDLNDAFFPFQRAFRPAYRIRLMQNEMPRPQYIEPEKNDPHALFEQFFRENEIKSETEKEFFKKHYPETVEEKFDAYKTLELNSDATPEQVKDAYRKLAIKYHPKNDSSPEAATKFADVAKAYEMIVDAAKSKAEGDLGFRSFFEDFQKEIDSIFYPPRTEEVKEVKQDKSVKEGKQEEKQKKEKNDYGVLYSESSHYESVNGKQTKYQAEKVYQKDGKLLKVKRQQKLKDDGNIEITETIDNGEEVKKKTFVQEKDTKKLGN